MKLLISITTKAEGVSDINKMFVEFDTDTHSFDYLTFNEDIQENANANRGMGMCYLDGFWCAGIFCVEHRVGSKLLLYNMETGEHKLNTLMLTKAIHSVRPWGKCGPYNMYLACSTQNDLITIVTTYETNVITEDVFFDYLPQSERIELDWGKEYVYDDLLHANDCYIDPNGDVLACMFYNFKDISGIDGKLKTRDLIDVPIRKEDVDIEKVKSYWRNNKGTSGAVWNLTRNACIADNLSQPHSITMNQFGNIVFCESGNYRLVHGAEETQAQCRGFTRGLCEDTDRGGYWVGLSYHRVFSDILPGAGLEFVDYNMNVIEYIDLSHIGKEIYDVIPYKLKGVCYEDA
jgi:hypothetical protein